MSQLCKGVLIYKSGWVYEGFFKNGWKEGRGFEYFPNGNMYKGFFSNDAAHG